MHSTGCAPAAPKNAWSPKDFVHDPGSAWLAKSQACRTRASAYLHCIPSARPNAISCMNRLIMSCLLHASGAISEPQVIAQFLTLLAGGLGVSYTLDRWAGHEFPTLLCLAVFGSFISYIYSAPPLKLKQSGWIGNYALGSSYIALPWWAGQVMNPPPAASLSWQLCIICLLSSSPACGL